jgi:hypothetical protein
VVHHAAATVAVKRAALAAVVLLVGCGGGDKPAGVSWQGDPVVVRQPQLPDDTIVSGQIRNSTGHTITLSVDDVRLRDAHGHVVAQHTARFSSGVTHQLYSPRDGPHEPNPAFLRRRLGELASVKAGETVPLVVSWRVRPGQAPPVRVDLGAGLSVTLPADSGPAT